LGDPANLCVARFEPVADAQRTGAPGALGQPKTDPTAAPPRAPAVLTCADCSGEALEGLLACYGLRLVIVAAGAEIPGSYWGAPEAGLVGDCLYVRPDTPVHSALHEACHYVCMDRERRRSLHTDAGGEFTEEAAVCYLQALLADRLPGAGRERLLADMDTWGYSFRLGSARAWIEQDAEDARAWLIEHGLITPAGEPTFRVRD